MSPKLFLMSGPLFFLSTGPRPPPCVPHPPHHAHGQRLASQVSHPLLLKVFNLPKNSTPCKAVSSILEPIFCLFCSLKETLGSGLSKPLLVIKAFGSQGW